MISNALIGLAALGKAGVFVVALVCLVRGEIGFRTFAVALGDLAFAAYFMAWLRAMAPARRP